MGASESKPEPAPQIRPVYVQTPQRPATPPRPASPVKPWREVHKDTFAKTEEFLKTEISKHKSTRLNVVLIGHSGAGKSTFINGIYSIAADRIVDLAYTRGASVGGVGTFTFEDFNAVDGDLFENVCFFDTMGFTSARDDIEGITDNDIKKVCEGLVVPGHEFNKASADGPEEPDKYRPHCVVFLVSAGVIDNLDDAVSNRIKIKLEDLDKLVPKDIARIAIITKIDTVCDETHKDITHIYSSKKVHRLVKKVETTFGIQEKSIFPIVNYVSDVVMSAEKNVPIMYAMYTAMNFALDRQRRRGRRR